MSLPSCRHRQVAAGHACGQVKSIHVDETEVFVQTANQTVHKGQCPRHHLNAFKFKLLHWMFAALLDGRCGQWCSFALGRRGAAIIVTASLALLQAQRIEFHPRLAQSWFAPWPKSFRPFSTTDQNIVLVLNDLMRESHRTLFCSNLRKHWTVACLFQQTSLLWIQHGCCHRNETPVFSCSSLRFADGSCGQNLREVFAWSMSRRLMPDHAFSVYAEKS